MRTMLWGGTLALATGLLGAASCASGDGNDTTLSLVPPPPPPAAGRPDIGLNGSLRGLRIFPAGDAWNQPVDTAAVDANSCAILAAIGLSRNLHPDFGANYNGGAFGIPHIVVPDSIARHPVQFEYSGESDPGPSQGEL